MRFIGVHRGGQSGDVDKDQFDMRLLMKRRSLSEVDMTPLCHMFRSVVRIAQIRSALYLLLVCTRVKRIKKVVMVH